MIYRVATAVASVMLLTAGALPAESVPAKSRGPSAATQPRGNPAASQSPTVPAGPVCVAILEPEVLADMPAEQRKALAGTIDTLLTASLAKQKGFVIVDRQALDKVLAERASKAGGVAKLAPGEVAEQLRPFWSAGVLICPIVRQVKADKANAPGKVSELVIEFDAVLAQTGQSLGEAHAMAKWRNNNWDKAPSLEVPLNALWSDLPDGLRRAMANRHIEIADVRLSSSLRRLQWMADAMGDALRASLAQPGVALLRPRHPASTKEERLLRVMGLSSPNGKDASASLACSPNFRLDAELSEEVGKDLNYDKTPITLSLSLRDQDGKATKQAFSGMASQYADISARASAWLNKQLAQWRVAGGEAQDVKYSRQLAKRELAAARQLEKLCTWYSQGWNLSAYEQVFRVKVLERALRAAHLDPTNEEAARLVALGIDAPYFLRKQERGSVCTDRVIAEGQRYLDRFSKSRQAPEVTSKIRGAAFLQLTAMRAGGNWSSRPYAPEIWRYARVSLLALDEDLHEKREMNIWANANLVGQCILMHCPPDRLEEERSYWRDCWEKKVEPLRDGATKGRRESKARGLDVPTWSFVELYYFIRKKDVPGMHQRLNELAQTYPRSHTYVWWGTRIWQGQPAWKTRVQTLLKECGDPEWKTWKPTFDRETFDWTPQAYGTFLAGFNPRMPQAWDRKDALPLPTDRITLENNHLATAVGRNKGFRPLLSAGGSMWICQPAPGEDLKTRRNLLLVPANAITAPGKDLHVKAKTLDWPAHPSDGQQGAPGQAVRCWLTTVEDNAPTVWIGTAWHGLARFDLRDGKWNGRWYAAKQGVPGEDILMVRPCMHDGKRKLLVLSQPKGSNPSGWDFEKHLWALDPSSGHVTLIATGKWDTIWYTKAPKYMGLIAAWKDGTKRPLRLYNRDDHPQLDANGIVSMKNLDRVYVLARDEGPARVWAMGGNGLTQFDARMSPQRLLDATPLGDEILYCSSETPTQHRSVEYGRNRFKLPSSHYYPVWQVLRAPVLDVQCCSDTPAVLWGGLGTWREARRNAVLAAYRPAFKAPLEDNDAWYGPWKTDMVIKSLDSIDGYLWLVTSGGNFHRFKPSEVIQSAREQGAVRSTSQWRSEYRKRLESSWVNAVRLHITDKEYDKALSAIAAQRQATKPGDQPATPACHLALWEALAYARKGDFATADRIYPQIADDTKAEPLARGVALVNLVNVRHAAKDWSGLEQALDKLVAMFPELNALNPFSCAETIKWYRQQAKRNSATSQPVGPVGGASRPNAAAGEKR